MMDLFPVWIVSRMVYQLWDAARQQPCLDELDTGIAWYLDEAKAREHYEREQGKDKGLAQGNQGARLHKRVGTRDSDGNVVILPETYYYPPKIKEATP